MQPPLCRLPRQEKRGWPKPPLFRIQKQSSLEVELQRQLNQPMAGLPIRITEPGIRKLTAGIEGQVVVIISVHKRRDRMIQEVIRREAELQLLLFAEV